MRIAVFTRYFPSVSQTFVIRQCAALVERGHDLTIFARRPKDPEPLHDDVERFGLDRRLVDWRAPPSPREALSILDPRLLGVGRSALGAAPTGLPLGYGERPLAVFRARALPPFDVVLCHFGPQGLLADWLRELGALSGPIVTVFHGFDVSGFVTRAGRDVYRDLFERCALALPVSEHWGRRLLKLGCPEDRLRVLHMGVRLSDFDYRERSRAPHEPLRLLGIGRMVEKKGFITSIEALAERRDVLGDFVFDLVGDGPERTRLEAAVRAAKLDDRVHFHGAQPAHFVKAKLDEAHLLLAPSLTAKTGDQEGIPVVLMEAMALGVPVLSTRHSGIPELVPAPQLVAEADPRALGDALVDLASHPERWPRIGREGREIVEREFSAGVVDDRLEELLREAAASSAAPGPAPTS